MVTHGAHGQFGRVCHSALACAAWTYAVLGAGALVLMVIGLNGMMRLPASAFAALYAMALGLPWSLALVVIPDGSPLVAGMVLVAAYAVNLALFAMLLRRWKRGRATGHGS